MSCYGFAALLAAVLIGGCNLLPAGAAGAPQGRVVGEDGGPLAEALVRLQGTAVTTRTDQEGRFEFALEDARASKYVTAWKPGYFNGGALRREEEGGYRIVLKPLPEQDNAAYRWVLPRNEAGREHATKACAECHAGAGLRLFDEWERSAHAKSAVNPLFLEFFSGSEEGGPLIPQLGYKKDFPRSNGNCASCHVPAMAVHKPFDSDPRQAVGVERAGVFCDLCHKIQDVLIDRVGGHPGTLALKFKRPEAGQQLFFGPLDDVHPGPDAFNPLYRQSRYCAACHNGRFWNLAVYSEFQEWSESSYARRNIQCQDCHMKPEAGTRRFALESEGSVVRDPATVASHSLLGIRDEAFMREAVKLSAQAEIGGGRLQATVTVANVGAGHHLPTGSPMRNLVLRVEARDASGRRLDRADGETVPQWAGTGPEAEGNYAGLPGKGYAKVLKRWPEYRGDNRSLVLTPLYPSPFWRPTVLDYDNRIAAEAADTSVYGFKLPADAARPIRVAVRLIYRKTFRSWLRREAEASKDLVLASENLTLP